MNTDQIQGAAKMVVGKVQEEAGNLVDNPRLVVMGIAKQVAGRAQKGRGDIKAKISSYRRRHPEQGLMH
ncbi:MAG TPA: CsbD family protein [Burkholderiales bacterium]|nr:CsbD family protein [Burkholderiales bacterium]